MGNQLSGNVLGVIGFGNIAFYVAKGLHSMGMKIVAYDPFASQDKADSINATLYTKPEDLDLLLQQCKVLTIHVPLTKQTKNLIGARELALMKKGSFVVNCARGGIVDEDALAKAMQSGHIAGCGLDCFTEEKKFVDDKAVPRDFCLSKAKNSVMTPHIGGMTFEAQEAVALDAALQICEYFLEDREPKYGIVKPDASGKLVDGRPAWMK